MPLHPNTIGDIEENQNGENDYGIPTPLIDPTHVLGLIERLRTSMLRDVPVRHTTITALHASLDSLSIKIGADTFRIDDPILRKNSLIWNEILRGDITRMNELTLLTDEVAEKLEELRPFRLALNNLITITHYQATVLAEAGIKSIELNGITTMDTDAFRSFMTGMQGGLSLKSLAAIPPNGSGSIKEFRGQFLDLSGLTTLTDEEATACRQLHVIQLKGLTSLTPEQAMLLCAKSKCYRTFDITSLTDDLAKQFGFSSLMMSLSLPKLRAITDTQAHWLAYFGGNSLDLGLRSISDRKADA